MNMRQHFRYKTFGMTALIGGISVLFFSSPSVLAQFPPERVYTDLFFDNYLSTEIRFIPRAYLNCQPGKIMANYEIKREPVGRASDKLLAQGTLSTFDCSRALEDGEGWLFKETWSADGNLCEGRLQLIDRVWHFDRAVFGKNCSFTGKSYLIPASNSQR